MKKKALALLILAVISAAVFAIPNPSRLTISPTVARQEIRYDRHYVNKATIGPGLSLDYYYHLDDNKALGGSLAAGYYNYKDFHYYVDTRLVGQFKFRAFNFDLGGEKSLAFNLFAGIGAGLAVRDDKNWGVYGVLKGGFSVDFNTRSGIGGSLGIDASISFQNDESAVAQYSLSLGLIVPLGGKK